MIQRIQTLYLVGVLLLSVLSFCFPLAVFETDKYDASQYNLIPKEVSAETTALPQTTIAWNAIFFPVATGILALVAIFLYKNRPLQMRITAFGFLFATIYVGLLLLWIISSQETALAEQQVQVIKTTYGVSTYLPMGQVLLFILAQRAIKKDEKMVRDSERIR
jgi:hypothetical protein